MAVHTLTHARLTVLGDEPGDIILLDEVVEIVVGLENDTAAATAVAAAGAALGDIGLAMKRDTAFAAMARAGVDFYFINKHDCLFAPIFCGSGSLVWLAKIKKARLLTSPEI